MQEKKQVKEQETNQQQEAQKAVFLKLVEQQRQGHNGDIVARPDEAQY